jgi:hypothetical protein
MASTQTNSILIDCPPDIVYRYVTQPWRWHEWHPNSKSARSASRHLKIGDTFDEVIEIQPLAPLPYRMTRHTHYRVLLANSPLAWEVRGDTHDGWLKIRYDLAAAGDGTLFKRSLTYQTRGLSAWLMPLLRHRMALQSEIALANLKTYLERQDLQPALTD